MKFFLDNNLSPHLARGMAAFGEDVSHLQDTFPSDAPDVEWLRHIGENSIILITRDERIRRNPAELSALRQFKVGAFYLGGKNRTRCELVQQLVRNWPRIKNYAAKENRPFVFRIPPRGTKFSKIPI